MLFMETDDNEDDLSFFPFFRLSLDFSIHVLDDMASK